MFLTIQPYVKSKNPIGKFFAVARLFDDFRRSTTLWWIAAVKGHGLLTDEKFVRFSQEAQNLYARHTKIRVEPQSAQSAQSIKNQIKPAPSVISVTSVARSCHAPDLGMPLI